MASNLLNFSFDEQPVWREKNNTRTTTEMISEITKRRKEYETLSNEAKQFCESTKYALAMAVDYIHNLNVGELVGTQKLEDTKKVLSKLYQKSAAENKGCTRSETETLNTCEAMKRFHNLHKNDMNKTGILTVQVICDVHEVLLKGVHPNCGKIRTRQAYTHWHGGPYYYPPPEVAEARFYALVDRHNIYMETAPASKESDEYTKYLFKCAARLLFEFVDTHPFSDGNGRMCRLLANYVVGLITPFPVSLYQTSDPARSGRDDYLNAIVSCRENPEEGPGGLAAMLVEGAWRGWENLFHNLERRHQLLPGTDFGPIVVKKSDCSTETISERVCRIWPRIQARVVDRTKEEIVRSIVEHVATQYVNFSSLRHSEHLLTHVPIIEGVRIELQIFNI